MCANTEESIDQEELMLTSLAPFQFAAEDCVPRNPARMPLVMRALCQCQQVDSRPMCSTREGKLNATSLDHRGELSRSTVPVPRDQRAARDNAKCDSARPIDACHRALARHRARVTPCASSSAAQQQCS